MRRMRKRIISVMVVAMISVMLFGQVITVSAETGDKMVEGSLLTKEDSSEGYTQANPNLRGQHLMEGNSGISKAGRGRIYAYGATAANHDVEKIAVIVAVDRYDENVYDFLN